MMKENRLLISLFKFVMITLFNKRFQRSSMQFSPGPALPLKQLLKLVWKDNTHLSIKPKQVQQRITEDSDFILLDIRSKKSFKEGHITNAVNIPLRKLFRMEELPFPKNAEIIVICYLGVTSKEAITVLAEHGHTNLINMAGGMGAWEYEQERTITAG